MGSVTQPLKDEHAELLPQVEAIRLAADAVGDTDPADLSERVARAYAFLTQHVVPHACAEEKALYPAVNQVMGSAEASSTMSLDHFEVRRLTGLLGELREKLAAGRLTHQDQRELRMVLYGLYVLLRLHLQKEEEAYLPLLDLQLTPEQARQMFAEMEAAAAEARARQGVGRDGGSSRPGTGQSSPAAGSSHGPGSGGEAARRVRDPRLPGSDEDALG